MRIYIGICAVLTVVVVLLVTRLVLIRRTLREIREELQKTREMSYNRQIRISLVDRELTEVTAEINRNLDYQKQLKLQAERAEAGLRLSISDIAHDLRTPLTVVKGNLQLLEQDQELGVKSRVFLRVCREQSDRLKEMVDDFFEMSVLESERISAVLQRVDITAVLMQFIIDHEAVLRAHDLEPELELPEKSIFIQADEQMLTRMLGNLLNNTVKYAKGTFRVRLEMIEEGRYCRLTFSNAVEHEERLNVSQLFERSYRADGARGGRGAGLGLYIVKLLAEKQGASVGAVCAQGQLSIELSFAVA
jgi:signal transduction histidine kinase